MNYLNTQRKAILWLNNDEFLYAQLKEVAEATKERNIYAEGLIILLTARTFMQLVDTNELTDEEKQDVTGVTEVIKNTIRLEALTIIEEKVI